MTKSKSKDVTRIGAIAIPYNDGQHSCVVLPKGWQGLRIFCVRKDDYDLMKRQEEKARVKSVGKLATALTFQSKPTGEMKWNKS